MKGRNRALAPPFELDSAGYDAWLDLQQELGGLRGRGFSTHQIWQICLMAEHTALYRRGKIEPKYLDALNAYREQYGLDPLPELRRHRRAA